MTTSTKVTATARGEPILTGTSAPVEKGKGDETCSEVPLKRLADVSSTDRSILTFIRNMNIYKRERGKLLQDLKKAKFIYATGQEKLLKDFNEAMLSHESAEEELARKLDMGTEEVLSLYVRV